MAARTRTLTQLQDALAERADIAIAASGVRDTTSIVNTRLNRAIQRWLLMVAESGDDANLKTVRTATATSQTRDAANWAPCQYVAQPSGLLFVRGIDIYAGSTAVSMQEISEGERNMFAMTDEWLADGKTGTPVFYRLGGINAAAASLIQIFPWADAVYTVDLRYIAAHTDISTGSDTIDFVAGGEEWVVNDAALQTLLADGLAGTATYSAMMGMNAQIERDMRFTLGKRSTIRKSDTKGRRAELERIANGGRLG